MRDREQGAVQREAMQVVLAAEDAVVLPLAIAHVADQRAADVLEVPANLVETAGVKTSFDEGVAAEDFAAPDLRARGHALLAGGARDGVVDEQVLGRMT